MISLARTTDKLQAFLGGAAATTNPTVSVFYHDIQLDQKLDTGEYPRGRQYTVLAGTAETDILAVPDRNVCRHIDWIFVYNADTAAVTVTICVDDNTTNRILVKKTLAIGQSLIYSASAGWQIV